MCFRLHGNQDGCEPHPLQLFPPSLTSPTRGLAAKEAGSEKIKHLPRPRPKMSGQRREKWGPAGPGGRQSAPTPPTDTPVLTARAQRGESRPWRLPGRGAPLPLFRPPCWRGQEGTPNGVNSSHIWHTSFCHLHGSNHILSYEKGLSSAFINIETGGYVLELTLSK